jgi:hypothetical protein
MNKKLLQRADDLNKHFFAGGICFYSRTCFIFLFLICAWLFLFSKACISGIDRQRKKNTCPLIQSVPEAGTYGLRCLLAARQMHLAGQRQGAG